MTFSPAFVGAATPANLLPPPCTCFLSHRELLLSLTRFLFISRMYDAHKFRCRTPSSSQGFKSVASVCLLVV